MSDDRSFIEALLRVVPELGDEYREHIAFYDELLPHVLMGDVTRFAIARSIDADDRSALLRLLAHLEQGLAAGSNSVQELIVVSFVENLQNEAPALEALWPLMGSNLKQEVAAICSEWMPGG